MANKDLKETKDVKTDELNKETQELLLTEEEFARRERAKVKERINRVTRVAGLFAILILVYAGIFDPLFELSFFGWIWDKNAFRDGWAALTQLGILDDIFQFGSWIAKLGITIILIGVVLLMVYFITYCIVDLIDLIKTFIAAGKDITGDLSGAVKDTIPTEKQAEDKKKEKKKLFDEVPDELNKKPKRERKKKEEKPVENGTDPLTGLSSEQLDALLRGEHFEMPQAENNTDNSTDSEGTKSLF